MTYPSSWYKEAADSLFGAFNGIGTTVSRVMSIINQLQTADDWNALVSAYGYRQTYIGIFKDFQGTLPQTLVDELGNDDLSKVRQHLKSIGATVGF